MPDFIEIEGQIARLVKRQITAEVPLSELMPHLTIQQPTFLPVLPDHTRIVAFNPETRRGAVLIELAPSRKGFRIHNDQGETRGPDAKRQNEAPDLVGVFQLQLPWAYFIYSFRIGTDNTAITGGKLQDFTIDQGLYFWRPDRIQKLDDQLWGGRIPNVDTQGWICWGNSRHETTSLANRINDMVKNFTNTKFNYHLGAPKPSIYPNYTEWEKDSLKNPLCFSAWEEWKTLPGRTIQSVFESLMDKDLPAASDLSRSELAIPEPPAYFSVARAAEWMNALPEQSRARFLHALRRWTDANPDPADTPTQETTDGSSQDHEATAEAAPDIRRT